MAPSVEVNLVQVRDDAVNQVHRNMGDDAPARSAPAHTAASLCDAITDSLSWPDHTDAFAVLGDTPVDRVIAHTLLRLAPPKCLTKYFTDEEKAICWLQTTG